jgi:molecular chaperone GrpE
MVGRKKKKSETEDSAGGQAAEFAAGGEAVEAEADQLEAAAAREESKAPTSEEVIEALSTELDELEDRHLRLVAEFDNFRKRTVKERAKQSQLAQAEVIRGLLDSLDDLSRVSEMGSTDHDAAAILEGVRLVEVKLQRALEGLGLKPIEAVGRPFNPELHDAMVTVATSDPEQDQTVSQELAKGYVFKETLVRPARVQVRMYQPDRAADDGSGGSEGGS